MQNKIKNEIKDNKIKKIKRILRKQDMNIDTSLIGFKIKMTQVGIFYVKHTIMKHDDVTSYVVFKLNDIDDKYIIFYDSVMHKLIVELPMRKNGNYLKVKIFINIDLSVLYINEEYFECGYSVKVM